jgi:hypothetical protein
MDFLQKICNEEGSSLQGLSYIGGPVHLCEHDHSEVVPCVSFPEDGDLVHSWTCDDCKESYDVEKLLDPKYKPTDGCLVPCKCESATEAPLLHWRTSLPL